MYRNLLYSVFSLFLSICVGCFDNSGNNGEETSGIEGTGGTKNEGPSVEVVNEAPAAEIDQSEQGIEGNGDVESPAISTPPSPDEKINGLVPVSCSGDLAGTADLLVVVKDSITGDLVQDAEVTIEFDSGSGKTSRVIPWSDKADGFHFIAEIYSLTEYSLFVFSEGYHPTVIIDKSFNQNEQCNSSGRMELTVYVCVVDTACR